MAGTVPTPSGLQLFQLTSDSIHGLPASLAFRNFTSSCRISELHSSHTFKRFPIISRRRTIRSFCSNTSVLQSETEIHWQLHEILDRLRLAVGLHDFASDDHITVSGKHISFGMEGDWRLTWCLDGRFYEQYCGSEMGFEYGYDAQHSPWHVDAAGRVSNLELDNLEACLLAVWVRTGYWLTDEGQRKLLIQMEEKTLLCKDSTNEQLCLSVCLKGNKIVCNISIDTTTWLPGKMECKAFGGTERWEFASWQNIVAGSCFKFAKSTSYYPAPGGRHLYNVESDLMGCSKQKFLQNCPYTHPNTSLLPRYTKFYPRAHINNSLLSSVKMVRSKSGHYLVRPLINDQDIGYFLVDTGASGLVISGKKANEFNMDTFGEVFVSGVEGKFRTHFRRGKRFQLGPLIIESPIYMEVSSIRTMEAPTDDIVKGLTEVVLGICGYDLFCHCIVEMSSADCTLSLYDPLLYKPPDFQIKWEALSMLDNVPHALAKFNGQSALLMLDTGGGGVDVIFHKRGFSELNLLNIIHWKGSAEITGLGTGSGGMKVEYGILDQMEVAGHCFPRVKTLHFSNDEGALDISTYTAGILCGDLIVSHIAIFDYPNHRFALVRTQS